MKREIPQTIILAFTLLFLGVVLTGCSDSVTPLGPDTVTGAKGARDAINMDGPVPLRTLVQAAKDDDLGSYILTSSGGLEKTLKVTEVKDGYVTELVHPGCTYVWNPERRDYKIFIGPGSIGRAKFYEIPGTRDYRYEISYDGEVYERGTASPGN